MPQRNWNDLSSIDYRSLSLLEREEFRRETIRQAHAARAEMMASVISAIPRLIRRGLASLAAPKRVRPVRIPRKEFLQV